MSERVWNHYEYMYAYIANFVSELYLVGLGLLMRHLF